LKDRLPPYLISFWWLFFPDISGASRLVIVRGTHDIQYLVPLVLIADSILLALQPIIF
jgi:hypothetical protein